MRAFLYACVLHTTGRHTFYSFRLCSRQLKHLLAQRWVPRISKRQTHKDRIDIERKPRVAMMVMNSLSLYQYQQKINKMIEACVELAECIVEFREVKTVSEISLNQQLKSRKWLTVSPLYCFFPHSCAHILNSTIEQVCRNVYNSKCPERPRHIMLIDFNHPRLLYALSFTINHECCECDTICCI